VSLSTAGPIGLDPLIPGDAIQAEPLREPDSPFCQRPVELRIVSHWKRYDHDSAHGQAFMEVVEGPENLDWLSKYLRQIAWILVPADMLHRGDTHDQVVSLGRSEVHYVLVDDPVEERCPLQGSPFPDSPQVSSRRSVSPRTFRSSRSCCPCGRNSDICSPEK
jgi:hypothetical protein